MERRNEKLYKWILFALFTAIILVMSFTPLGYLKIGVIEITFLTIPVALGAVLLGPAFGTLLGLIFGLTSFFQCVFGLSGFGATLLGINPFFCAFVCIVPRVLEGLISGLVARALQKVGKVLAFTLGGFLCAFSNTLFFMTSLILLFGQTDYIRGFQGDMNVFTFVIMFVGLNGLLEIAVTTVVTPLVAVPVSSAINRR